VGEPEGNRRLYPAREEEKRKRKKRSEEERKSGEKQRRRKRSRKTFEPQITLITLMLKIF
jgi:hypothetical protein